MNFELLFDLEKQLHSFEVRSNIHKISKLLSDDFFEFGSSGNIWTRAEILSRLPSEDGQTKIESYNFQAKILAENIVLVTYVSKRISDEVSQNEFLRSSIWLLVNNEWKMKFHQGTAKAVK